MSDDLAGDTHLSPRAPDAPSPHFGPRAWLEHLIAVYPIAQSRTHGDVTLTLFSLESFNDGFRIRGRVLNTEAPPTDGPLGFPHLTYEVRDDLGGVYTVQDVGGHGARLWEFAAVSYRPLDGAAQQLVIIVPEIEWRDFTKMHPEWVIAREPVNFTYEVAVPHAG